MRSVNNSDNYFSGAELQAVQDKYITTSRNCTEKQLLIDITRKQFPDVAALVKLYATNSTTHFFGFVDIDLEKINEELKNSAISESKKENLNFLLSMKDGSTLIDAEFFGRLLAALEEYYAIANKDNAKKLLHENFKKLIVHVLDDAIALNEEQKNDLNVFLQKHDLANMTLPYFLLPEKLQLYRKPDQGDATQIDFEKGDTESSFVIENDRLILKCTNEYIISVEFGETELKIKMPIVFDYEIRNGQYHLLSLQCENTPLRKLLFRDPPATDDECYQMLFENIKLNNAFDTLETLKEFASELHVPVNISGIQLSNEYFTDNNLNDLFKDVKIDAKQLEWILLNGYEEYLSGVDLSDVEFSEAMFLNNPKLPAGIKLTRDQVAWCVKNNKKDLIAGSDLRGVNLNGIDINGVDFSNVLVDNITKINTDFETVSITLGKKSSEWEKFRITKLIDSDLSNSDCSESDYRYRDLSGVIFGVNTKVGENTKLFNARLGADQVAWFVENKHENLLHDIDLTDVDLSGIKSLGEINLRGVTLSGADLSGVDLREAKLDKNTIIDETTVLTGAKLSQHQLDWFVKNNKQSFLTGTHLSNLRNLSGVNLRGVNLSQADLRGVIFDEKTIVDESTNLTGVKLGREQVEWFLRNNKKHLLHDLDLRDVDLTNLDFTGCNFKGTNFSGALLDENALSFLLRNNYESVKEVDLTACNDFNGINFGYLNLVNCKLGRKQVQWLLDNGKRNLLIGTNLQNADLSNMKLISANFRGADLCGVDFSGSVLSQVLFDENTKFDDKTNFKGVHFERQQIQFFIKNEKVKYLAGVDLTGVDLSGLDLSNANLSGAILKGANLIGAKMNNVCLNNVDLTETKMNETTKFNSGCQFKNATLNTDNLGIIRCNGQGHFDFKSSDIKIVGTDYSKINFTTCLLSDRKFENSNFQGSDFTEIQFLGNVSFKNCDLRNVNFTRACNVKETIFDNVTVDGNSLRWLLANARQGIRNLNIDKAEDLRRADLTGVTFHSPLMNQIAVGRGFKKTLIQCDLKQKDLHEFDLKNAVASDLLQLQGTNLERASIEKAVFHKGIVLSDTTQLSGINIESNSRRVLGSLSKIPLSKPHHIIPENEPIIYEFDHGKYKIQTSPAEILPYLKKDFPHFNYKKYTASQIFLGVFPKTIKAFVSILKDRINKAKDFTEQARLFETLVTLMKSHGYKEMDLRGIQFKEIATVDDVNFIKKIDFRDALIDSKLVKWFCTNGLVEKLKEIKLPHLDLSNSNFFGNDLSGLRLTSFKLEKSNFANANLDNVIIKPGMSFEGCKGLKSAKTQTINLEVYGKNTSLPLWISVSPKDFVSQVQKIYGTLLKEKTVQFTHTFFNNLKGKTDLEKMVAILEHARKEPKSLTRKALNSFIEFYPKLQLAMDYKIAGNFDFDELIRLINDKKIILTKDLLVKIIDAAEEHKLHAEFFNLNFTLQDPRLDLSGLDLTRLKFKECNFNNVQFSDQTSVIDNYTFIKCKNLPEELLSEEFLPEELLPEEKGSLDLKDLEKLLKNLQTNHLSKVYPDLSGNKFDFKDEDFKSIRKLDLRGALLSFEQLKLFSEKEITVPFMRLKNVVLTFAQAKWLFENKFNDLLRDRKIIISNLTEEDLKFYRKNLQGSSSRHPFFTRTDVSQKPEAAYQRSESVPKIDVAAESKTTQKPTKKPVRWEGPDSEEPSSDEESPLKPK